MKILHVIPVSKGIGKEKLTYFSSNDIKEGALVYVPLRNKETPAIVLKSEDLKDMKAQIRSSKFSLKKIISKKGKNIFYPEFIKTAQKISYENAISTGAVISALTPKAILEDLENIKEITLLSKDKKKSDTRDNVITEKLILQNNFNFRIEEYKNIIRGAFAKNSSVLICTPTIKEAIKINLELKKGIENFSFILHSGMTKKEQRENWNKIISTQRPIFVVLTSGYLSIPIFNIGTIIIENENSSFYKTNSRPYLDNREVCEKISENYKVKLVLGGFPLRINTFFKYKEGFFEALDSPVLRFKENIKTSFVDMRKSEQEKESAKKKDFSVLSEDLKELIKNSQENKEKLFIFSFKKGLSSTVVCEDCGLAVQCEKCKTPISLFKKGRFNTFVCPSCSTERDALEGCVNCGSWKLKDLGIGIEKVISEIEKEFNDLKVLSLTSENASTHKKAEKIIGEFYSSDNTILVGTQKSLPYLNEVDYFAIASLDSLLSVPEFKIEEKIFSMISEISTKTKKNFLIQTRMPDSEILTLSLNGDFSEFYKKEIEMRRDLNYPPFSKIIKISCVSTPTRLKKLEKHVEEALSGYEFKKYHPFFARNAKGKKSINFLIKTDSEKWPDENLLGVLKNLPMECIVDTTPESLFS